MFCKYNVQMIHVRAAAILSFFLIIQLLAGCSSGTSNPANSANASNSSPAASNSAKTNVEELGVLINMPFEAEDVVWKDFPEQKKVVAVLRFSPADAYKLVQNAEKFRKPNSVTVGSENWFPPELIAQSDLSGNNTLKGTSYAANEFFQPPYNEGQITRIEGSDYFVLEVAAK